MPVANPQKKINVSSMNCGGTATVTLGFESAASLAFKPADIVLIMDRSASMHQDQMTYAKAAANLFVDMVAGARDGATRMGMVSFGDDVTKDAALSSDFSPLKPAIDKLVPGGHSNHRGAFEAAGDMLDGPGSVRQVIVMFTDGESSPLYQDPASAVKALKAKGIEIFCIGLAVDPASLNSWASDPDSTHVAYTEDAAQLDRVFRQIATEVVLAGARDAVIQEQLTKDFKIVKAHTPDVGTVDITGPQTLTWNIGATGIGEQPDYTYLSFDIQHIGTAGGVLPVNQSVVYSDREGNTLEFPSPTVEVICSGGGDIVPEPCPEPTMVTVPGCQDALHMQLSAVEMQSLGRIVQLDVTVKAVCPGKRVAVSILLSETDAQGQEHPRGVKHLLIPAQEGTECRDITLRCIPFSVPEALDASGDPGSICNSRSFQARAIANYVDTDYACCDVKTEIL